ncbi:MAG: VOC family protein, partial [Vicinamibacterales bacterium]
MKPTRRFAIAAALTAVCYLGLLSATERPNTRTSEASDSNHTLPVSAVDSIGMTVSDMDRAVEFYTSVLTFSKISEIEVAGREYELLTGLFGVRLRIVQLRLGDETIELTEYLAPKGRAIPDDMRPNDRAFQHVAIIVSDMDQAYARLRQFRVEHASTGPQRLPDWNPNAGGI